jgi:hypothetical protein
VLREQRHQLVALAGLAPAPLGVLLESRIGAHLRRATGTTRARTTVAHRRAARTTWTRATIAKRRTRSARSGKPRARATRATIAKRRAWSTRTTVPERRARTWADARHRRRQTFEGRTLATTVRPTEALATARRTATTTVAAALAATATATARPGPATTATRPDGHVATPTLVVVHAAAVHALAPATALAVVVRAHLDDHRRPIVDRRRRSWGDPELLEICELLQQRFLKTLSHPFSYCARAMPTSGARSR